MNINISSRRCPKNRRMRTQIGIAVSLLADPSQASKMVNVLVAVIRYKYATSGRFGIANL